MYAESLSSVLSPFTSFHSTFIGVSFEWELQDAKDRLYATSWTEPPGLASYRINPATPSSPPTVSHLNSVETAARSGYVCVSSTTAYSTGGPTGEVFALDEATGGFREGKELQKLDFVGNDGRQKDDGGVMDFGGLRHGSHSFDLSPDGKLAYVADMYVHLFPFPSSPVLIFQSWCPSLPSHFTLCRV
jgi:hypothetical protein